MNVSGNITDTTIKGGTDGTTIGNVGDKLKVDATVTSNSPVNIGTPKIEIGLELEQDLPAFNSPYYVVTTITDEILLHGITLGFKDDNVMAKVTIDGIVLFEVDCDDLEKSSPPAKDQVQMKTGMWLEWLKSGDFLVIRPLSPFYVGTELKIEVKSNSNNTDRELQSYQVNSI